LLDLSMLFFITGCHDNLLAIHSKSGSLLHVAEHVCICSSLRNRRTW
jgi:hypothetical protein